DRDGAAAEPIVAPLDPRQTIDGPLDPALETIRSSLAGHRRRLWLRRIARRAWLAAAATLVAVAVLLIVARLFPIEALPSLLVAIVAIGLGVFLFAAVRCRPSLGETALAVDAEAHLGDRVSSALALAAAHPAF